MEFDAAFAKGKAWMRKLEWVKVSNQFKAMAECLAKLVVSMVLICLSVALISSACLLTIGILSIGEKRRSIGETKPIEPST